MKILPDTFRKNIAKKVFTPQFSLPALGFFVLLMLAGPLTFTCKGLAKEPGLPIHLEGSTPTKIKIDGQITATENLEPERIGEPAPATLSKKQQQEIIEKNVQIRKLQEGIIDQKIKILGSRKKERTLLGDLESIEKELQAQKDMLAALREKSERQELLLTDKQEYLRQVLAEKRKHQIIVKKRLAAYYRMGSVGLMNVVFSTESLPELLEFKEYFTRMVQHDHAIIQKYLAELNESNKAREEHAREKLRLMKMADDVRSKEEELKRIQQEKNLLLKKVNTEQQLYEQAVQEIEEAVADLAITLQKVQAAAAVEPFRGGSISKSEPENTRQKKETLPPGPEGFPAQKGALIPPVEGAVIGFFGQKVKGKFNTSSTTNGIDIRVQPGVAIKAVYDGRIIHSGYLRGYGNLMIIDHGHQYFSLTSRAAEFYKGEGSKVSTGEIIGITGEGDPLYGEGLHFEIRRGSNPEDPLLWLKKNVLPVIDADKLPK